MDQPNNTPISYTFTYTIPILPAQPIPQNILHSDHIPSETDIPQNRVILEQEEELLRMYDEEIARLQPILENLKHQRSQVQDRINKRRSVISVLRRFPTEILGEIFWHCVGDVSLYITRRRFSTVALNISHVCSRWRTIVIGLPNLWSTIAVDFYKLYSELKPVMKLYLDRSGDHPLKILFTTVEDDSDKLNRYSEVDEITQRIGEGASEAVETLGEHSARIEALEIDIPGLVLDHLFNPFNRRPYSRRFDMRSLKFFRADNNVYRGVPGPLSWDRISKFSPSLTDVSLGCECSQAHEILPHTQLRSLDIGRADSESDVLDLLEKSKNLERLVVHLTHWKQVTPMGPSITHTSITPGAQRPCIRQRSQPLLLAHITFHYISYSLDGNVRAMLASATFRHDRTVLGFTPATWVAASPNLRGLEFELNTAAGKQDLELLSQLTLTNDGVPVFAPNLTQLWICVERPLTSNAEVKSRLLGVLESRKAWLREVKISPDLQSWTS
ncbi:hypothetical protein V5O48_012003 [Marasmius crinis-equi]|uniref:F-box domain-containing protein n=1 Tax=Marasmius crinis-equi TaxID=585013 RepID=A0ABR3F455_9AGAR